MRLDLLELLKPRKKMTTKKLFQKILFQFFICIFLSFIASLYLRNKIFINNSPSVPVGFYWKQDQDTFVKGNVVFFKVPEKVRKFLSTQQFIPEKTQYILKKIGGVEGDHIVIQNKKLYINNKFIYDVFETTPAGFFLNPIESLDYVLQKEEYFLIGDLKESYDSRYFGVVRREELEGTGKLLFSTDGKTKETNEKWNHK